MRYLIKVFTIAFMAAASLYAIGDDTFQGEVLWWMVGDPTEDYGNLSGITIRDLDGSIISPNADSSYTVRDMDINAARVRVVGTDQYLELIDVVEGTVQPMSDVGEVPDYFFASVVPYNSTEYSFMIELGNYDWDNGTWTTLAISDAASYDTLRNVTHNITEWSVNEMPTPTGGAWAPTAYTVPEPSGGLLMLVGGALLALRRRRKGRA